MPMIYVVIITGSKCTDWFCLTSQIKNKLQLNFPRDSHIVLFINSVTKYCIYTTMLGTT